MEYLDKYDIQYDTEFFLKGKWFDFITDNNVLIEINPFPFHNITWSPFNNPREKDYHYNKSMLAQENEYRCIHVWDWDDSDKIVQLLLPREKIYARKCEIREVKAKDAKAFINEYHLQGSVRGDGSKNTIRLGLYYNDELVSIMTFGKPRYNKNYQYELLRFCSSYAIIGGAEKLFKHFLREYNPKSIISYCDFSKFTGRTYEKLGFVRDGISLSSHWYNGREHITDNLLRQQGVDRLLGTNYGKNTNNRELMIEHGFVEIVDAGQIRYIYINEEASISND